MTTPPPAHNALQPLVRLDYHQQRLRHTQVLLQRWLRRWAVFLATGLLLLAAGASSATEIAATVLGSLVVPLTWTAGHPVRWLALTGLYTLLCTLPVLATRPLWWPARWAEAERALPLAPALLRRSDGRLLRWLLLPTQVPLWAGMAVLVWRLGQAQWPALVWAALALASAGLGAAALGLAWMHRLRQQQAVLHHDRVGLLVDDRQRVSVAHRPGAAQPGPARLHWATAHPLTRWHWVRVTLWWPLWRGQASRTARGLLLASATGPALAAAPLAAPSGTGWWLAALALLGLGATAWLRARSEAELQTRWHRLCHLPIAPGRWRAARQGLTLLPLLLAAVVGLCVTGPLLWAQGAHPLPWLAYWAVLLCGATLEAWPPPRDAGHHAARALLLLALAVALGSEVAP